MKTKILASISGLLVSLITPLAILVPQASAVVDTCTWVGGTDSNFSTAANWSCSIDGVTIPENGDTIQFDMSNATEYSEILNNNIVGLNIAGINLTGENGDNYGFQIEGNELTISGDITGDQTDGSLTLALDVVFGSDVNYSVSESTVFFGTIASTNNLDIGAHNFNYESQFADCRNIYIYSDLSGTGNIVSSSGSSEIILRGSDNGFSGDLTINGYGISIFADSMLGFDSTITMNGSSRLNLASSSDYTFDISEIIMNSSLEGSIRANPFVSNSCGGGLGDPSTTTVAGDLTLLTSTSFTGYNNLIIEGTFTDNANSLTTVTGSTGSITTSEGTVETEATSITINTDDKSTAFLSILNKQTVVLNGERGNVYVNSGGILKGNGSADSIFVYDGGTIAPGLSPGCLTITGNGLSIDSGTYQVEIQGNTVCTEYDQVDVTGAVNLSNDPTLNVSFLSSFVPALNDEFVIINNDAADVVTGTFTGLVEGATILVDGVTFQISYIGGDGNDVVLTATAVPAAVAAPDTGVGQLLQNPVFTLFAVLMSAGTLIAFKKFQSAK